MAGTLLRTSDKANTTICEYCVDTVDELALLPTMTKPASGKFADEIEFKKIPSIGSTCIVGNGSGALQVYMLFSSGWKLL